MTHAFPRAFPRALSRTLLPTTRIAVVAMRALAAATIALAVTPGMTGEAEARAESGFCSVYKGNSKIDENTCLAREICYYNQTRGSQLCRTEYLWPTNATTLVTYDASGRATLVNGAPAKARTIGGQTCALNTVSGNTFCYSRR